MPKFITSYPLPTAIYNACLQGIRPPKPKEFSATNLIMPPQIRRLQVERWEELEIDLCDRVWAVFGQSLHSVLDKHAPLEALSDNETLSFKINNTMIRFRQDLWQDNKISDYKYTSVWSFIYGDKPEWTEQLNIYAYGLKQYNFDTDKLEVVAILKDWKRRELEQYKDKYPPHPIIIAEVPLWTPEKTEELMRLKIKEHLAEIPRPCTPQEQWRRNEKWAVHKGDNKKAMPNGVKGSFAEAEEFIVNTGLSNLKIEHREGKNIRCEEYCPVRAVCKQHQEN